MEKKKIEVTGCKNCPFIVDGGQSPDSCSHPDNDTERWWFPFDTCPLKRGDTLITLKTEQDATK